MEGRKDGLIIINTKRIWVFENELKERMFYDFLDLASEVCCEFILVRKTKEHYKSNDNDRGIYQELSKYKIESKRQGSWPGTTMRGNGYSIVHYYKFNNETKEILKKYFNSMYSMLNTTHFEDLSFFMSNRKLWFASITHEKESWFENVSDYDIKKLKNIEGIEIKDIVVKR